MNLLVRKCQATGIGSLGLIPCILAFAASAQAAPITYSFTGTVSQVASPAGTPGSVVPVVTGQQVPILVTLDSALPDSDPSPDIGDYVSPGSFTSTPMLSATIAGQDMTGLFSEVLVNTGISIEIRSASPQTSAGFDILLSGAQPGVLPTDAIPLSLNPGDFSTATFSRTVLSSPAVTGFSGTIQAADIPASLPVLASGLGLLWAARRRAQGGIAGCCRALVR